MLQRRRLRLRDQLEGDALAAEAADAEQDAAEHGEQEIRGGLILLGLGIDFSPFSSQFMVWLQIKIHAYNKVGSKRKGIDSFVCWLKNKRNGP